METTLTIVLPVFGLIALGFGVGKTSLLSDDGIKGLTNFVFYVAIPGLLLKTMGTLHYPDGVDLTILVAYFGAALTLYACVLVLGMAVFRLPLAQAAMMAMSASFSNLVLLALPLVLLAFGEDRLLPLLLIISIHPIVLITVPTILIEIGRGRGTRWNQVFGSVLLSLVRNPIIVGMAVGVLYGLTGLGFDPIFSRFIDFLARAAAPCALFALGASLTRYEVAGDMAEVMSIVILKLVALPAMVWISTSYVFEIDPLWAAIATLAAAMPTGANAFVLASRYEIYLVRSAAAVLITTALAILSAAFLINQFAMLAG